MNPGNQSMQSGYNNFVNSLSAVALAVALIASAFAAPTDPVKFVQANCNACHNASMASDGIDFTALSAGSKTFGADREVWERVLTKLKAGEMPPPGLPKPPAADTAAVTTFLESEFARQDAAIKPEPGRVSARRLNRAEYNDTVRDLLGVDIHPADSFPADQAAFGFDDISDALSINSVLLEKYADAADRSVRTAIYGPEKLKPSMQHYPFPVRLNLSRGQKPKVPDAEHYDLTGLSSLHASHVMHRFPVDGTYSFRVVFNGHRPNQSMPAQGAVWIDGKMIKELDVDATDLEGQVREFRAKVTAGEHLISCSYLKEYHGLPPSYGGPEPSTRPPVPLISARGKLSEQDIETLRRLGTTIKTDSIETRIDNRFESIDIGGPFDQATGPTPESLHHVFVCDRQTAGCARAIVSNFAARAFRRPVSAKEVAPYLTVYALVRKQGDSFNEGIVAALDAVLVSPNFIYRIEHDRPTEAGRTAVPVTDYEMASRLSYFLWSTMPDEELMRLAADNRLCQPAVLEAQVRRMLQNEKAGALVENFAGQWLQFRNIDVVRPDGERYPDFDASLRYSMRRETELFVENIVRHDGSVLDFLNADYSFLNERLARFYGVPGVTGPEFRRVDMSGTNRGGGILAQGSILTISSYSTRTSPVLRGKWILENLLNAPPPPPPPSVPALDDTKVGESASLRQQMEAHRANAVCASCHSKMDPLGFGLENLNAIGAWRDKDGKFPVDASGVLPGGQKFQGPNELKALLLERRNAFVAGLSEKMLMYALGRGLERYDRPALQTIEAGVASHDFKFSELVTEVVKSLPFQMKRARESGQLSASMGDSVK
jgi:mono/diheme cytochrome c family protein